MTPDSKRRATLRTIVAAGSMLLVVSGNAGAQAIVKIGCVLPLSGGSAALGNQTRVGVMAAVEQINAAGGIEAMGGAKLQALFGDSQSKADVGVSETERLIQRENVAVLCGAFNSAVTFPATELAERNKTPWVVVGAVKDEITERGFRYVFRINNKATYDAREQLDAMALLAKETGKSVQRLALFYESGDWGRSHAANIRKLAAERKIGIILDEPAPPNQVDFTSQLLKIRSAKPDALILALYTPDHLLFTRQLAEQRLDLPFGVHSAGGGAEDPSFYAAIDASMAAYYFVQEDWQVDILDTNQDPLLLDADRRARALLGYGMSASVALGLAATYVIGDALERAGSAERDKLRDAIAATDLTSGPALFTGYQRIKFDSAGQNTFAHGVVSENLGGKRRAIWPSENRAADTRPVWPVPVWARR
ncbi:ABC transporter substrate-binding protein [Verminephrobacter eiseniae]|uniref:ABC transporter substrate-binding protein n=1 Tax=Verminephrobacter eiseniae TaxID=364317 RepID=UPI00223752CB|nr:ABC transporter substrate-binding protein [Verminephrobacter eiseniae]MCW5235783.1 ABC transporter substrate-binding protein [Verminephrobacter eiseniae]